MAENSTKLADPGAWAVSAFATTSFMLGMYNAGLLHSGGVAIVFPAAFFFGGMIQIIVGIIEVMRGNMFGAVVFGTYGPFWVIFAAVETWFGKQLAPADAGAAISLFLAMFAVLTFYFFLASLRTDWVLVVIFALIFIALVLLSIGAASGVSLYTVIGGWVTLVFAVIAWYHAAGDLINFTFGNKVVPLFPVRK